MSPSGSSYPPRVHARKSCDFSKTCPASNLQRNAEDFLHRLDEGEMHGRVLEELTKPSEEELVAVLIAWHKAHTGRERTLADAQVA